jgi:hypothetical protein
VLSDVLRRQHGMLTRGQALACGLSEDAVRARLASGRWRQWYPGIYAAFTGEVPRIAALWAAVLRAGPDAILSHQSAAELAGLLDQPAEPIHVTIPATRRITGISGVAVHLSRRCSAARHPTREPPQTRIEETVLDLVGNARSLDEALGWITKACGRRLTTTERLLAALGRRRRMRWRRQLLVALDDVQAGCHSLLELRYLRVVERAHGLPDGRRQAPRSRSGGRFYEDVRYAAFGVSVELDGRVAHGLDTRFRDFRRDNAAVQDGAVVLRYGWGDVHERPCLVAMQVAAVLQKRGWTGRPRQCPACKASA